MNFSSIFQVLICATATASQSCLNAPDTNDSIYDAIRSGDAKRLRVLLQNPSLDPRANGNRAVVVAVEAGHVECLELLLEDKRANPAHRDSVAIEKAIKDPNPAFLRLLLKDGRADPTFDYISAFKSAASNGYEDHFRLLLADPRMDPSDEDNAPFLSVIKTGHVGCIKALLEDGRVDLGILKLNSYPPELHSLITLIQFCKANGFLAVSSEYLLALPEDAFYILVRRHRDSPQELDYLLDIQLERIGVAKEAQDFAAYKAFVSEKISDGIRQTNQLAALLSAFIVFRTIPISAYPISNERSSAQMPSHSGVDDLPRTFYF